MAHARETSERPSPDVCRPRTTSVLFPTQRVRRGSHLLSAGLPTPRDRAPASPVAAVRSVARGRRGDLRSSPSGSIATATAIVMQDPATKPSGCGRCSISSLRKRARGRNVGVRPVVPDSAIVRRIPRPLQEAWLAEHCRRISTYSCWPPELAHPYWPAPRAFAVRGLLTGSSPFQRKSGLLTRSPSFSRGHPGPARPALVSARNRIGGPSRADPRSAGKDLT